MPGKDWPGNSNIENILKEISHIKEQTKDLSWADLIILAGNTALEQVGGKAIKFCGGRTDALDGSGSQYLHPTITGELSDSLVYLKDWIEKLDLTKQEFTALYGLGYSVGDSGNCDGVFCGRDSEFSSSHMQISNVLFNELLSGNWHLQLPTINFGKYQAVKYSLYNVITMQEMFFAFSFLVIRGENWFNKLPHHFETLNVPVLFRDWDGNLYWYENCENMKHRFDGFDCGMNANACHVAVVNQLARHPPHADHSGAEGIVTRQNQHKSKWSFWRENSEMKLNIAEDEMRVLEPTEELIMDLIGMNLHHQNLVAHAIIFELKTSRPTFDQIVADAKFHLGMTENGTRNLEAKMEFRLNRYHHLVKTSGLFEQTIIFEEHLAVKRFSLEDQLESRALLLIPKRVHLISLKTRSQRTT